MLLAQIDSLGYNVVLVLHLLFVVVAFAPAFVWPVLNRQSRVAARSGGDDASSGGNVASGAIGRIIDPMMHGGSLVLAGLFGILVVVASSKAFEFSQSWVSIAFVLWFLMLGVFFAGLYPAQRAVQEGKADAEQRLAMFYGGMHLLLLLQIIVMVWKPGL